MSRDRGKRVLMSGPKIPIMLKSQKEEAEAAVVVVKAEPNDRERSGDQQTRANRPPTVVRALSLAVSLPTTNICSHDSQLAPSTRSGRIPISQADVVGTLRDPRPSRPDRCRRQLALASTTYDTPSCCLDV